MIFGIFCEKSGCVHNYECNCMLVWEETKSVDIDANGQCTTFEPGEHEGYKQEENQ